MYRYQKEKKDWEGENEFVDENFTFSAMIDEKVETDVIEEKKFRVSFPFVKPSNYKNREGRKITRDNKSRHKSWKKANKNLGKSWIEKEFSNCKKNAGRILEERSNVKSSKTDKNFMLICC